MTPQEQEAAEYEAEQARRAARLDYLQPRPGDVTTLMAGRLAAVLPTLGRCKHVRPGESSVWLPARPERLRCAPCADLALAGVRGCAACGSDPAPHRVTAVTTADVAVLYDLCGACSGPPGAVHGRIEG